MHNMYNIHSYLNIVLKKRLFLSVRRRNIILISISGTQLISKVFQLREFRDASRYEILLQNFIAVGSKSRELAV